MFEVTYRWMHKDVVLHQERNTIGANDEAEAERKAREILPFHPASHACGWGRCEIDVRAKD